MRKIKIFLSVIIPDIGGILFSTIPMVILLKLTRFFAGETQYSPTLISAILLISLALLIIPFRLMLIFAQLFRINITDCGAFSIAIIGGFIAGSFFYLLILSHFSLNWMDMLDYALLGVVQSVTSQFIFRNIPDEWKLQLIE